jgi:hypothetical protein
MKGCVMQQLREVEETPIIDHWSRREEREAFLFFRDIEDRIWFARNPSRKLRVRQAEAVEVATLTAFERMKLKQDAPLRARASNRDVVPVMMIAIRVGGGRVPYRPIPISPHISIADTDTEAANNLLQYWCSVQDQNFIFDEDRIAEERDRGTEGRCPGFTKERETGLLRLPWLEGPDASSGPGWPSAS